MTIEQIIAELESLRDLTNDHGKRTIEGIKAGVKILDSKAAVAPIDVKKAANVEEVKPMIAEKRSKKRDPFESEQKKAIDLGYVKK